MPFTTRLPQLSSAEGVVQGQLPCTTAGVSVVIVIAAFVPFLTNHIIPLAEEH